MIPLLVTDLPADAQGMKYQYPQAQLFQAAGFADIRQFEAVDHAGKVVIKLKLDQYPNPLNAPVGFSLATTVVFIDTAKGGKNNFTSTGLHAPDGQGWEYALWTNGWESQWVDVANGTITPIKTVLNNSQELETSLPLQSGDYGYAVMAGLYDGFAQNNLRTTRTGGGTWWIDAPTGSPPVVDVLSDNQANVYSSRVMEFTKAIPDKTRLAIVVAAAGLLVCLLAFVFRKPKKIKV